MSPALGGTGTLSLEAKPGEAIVAEYVMATQLIAQAKAVGLTLLWSGIGSLVLFKLVDIVMGLRPDEQSEREGLDITQHGERAYNS